MSAPIGKHSTISVVAFDIAPPMASTVVPVITLASQAIKEASIKTHIPVFLDMKASNYTKWRTFFLSMVSKFCLLPHVDGTVAQPDNLDWAQHDFTVLTWLYGSISDDILDIIMELNQIACDLWTRVKALFHENMEARAPNLEAKFTTLVQGDLSITSYCHR